MSNNNTGKEYLQSQSDPRFYDLPEDVRRKIDTVANHPGHMYFQFRGGAVFGFGLANERIKELEKHVLEATDKEIKQATTIEQLKGLLEFEFKQRYDLCSIVVLNDERLEQAWQQYQEQHPEVFGKPAEEKKQRHGSTPRDI